jgi:Glycosyl hydrolase family 12
MKWRKIGLPLLIGLSVAVGPVFLTNVPQALAAQGKPAKPAKAASPAKQAKPAKTTITSAKFDLCRREGTIRVHGGNHTYLVNNDNFVGFGECLTGVSTAPAFRIAVSRATATADSDSYPDIFTGCSWGRCAPNSKLPARVSSVGNLVTTWDTRENAAGSWAAAYDLWLNPRSIRNGQADTEMMIWLNTRDLYNPAGMGWPVAKIDGAQWYVLTWITGNGHQTWRYVQFRKYTPRWNVTGLSLKPFFQYLEREGWVTPSWYVLNVEAGFEIWTGGTGLATTAFSVS